MSKLFECYVTEQVACTMDFDLMLWPTFEIAEVVRADYFAGTGPEAGEYAAKFNQPRRLWVLWPK